MIQIDSGENVISIDIKRSRIRIFKSMLQAIGSPKFIQLLVSPEQKAVAIRGTDSEEAHVHKIGRLGYKRDLVEIYSMTFMTKLMEIAEIKSKTGTYRLVGIINPAQQVVYCPLSTIKETQENI